MSYPPAPLSSTASTTPSSPVRHYRLVDQRGEPHPVLDDLYESIDSAWTAAIHWWNSEIGTSNDPVGIGIEVSTLSGCWRTIRYPQG